MIDTLFYWSGAAIWTVIAIIGVFYVLPLVPFLIVGGMARAVDEIHNYFEDRWYGSVEAIKQARHEGEREYEMLHAMFRLKRWLLSYAERYIDWMWAVYYGYLPFASH